MQKNLTVLFAFAIFVLVVGWSITPAQANKPDNNDEHDHGDGGIGALDIAIELMDGAFVTHSPEIPHRVTPESEFELRGDEAIHMIRPGGPDGNATVNPVVLVCEAMALNESTEELCKAWNGVFNLCGLLGPSNDVDVLDFEAPFGRKGWTVAKVVDEVSVGLSFELFGPLSDDPLKVSLQLKGPCIGDCVLIPTESNMGVPVIVDDVELFRTLTIPLTRYSIHLRGKGGVTHNALCHARLDEDEDDLGTLLITETLPAP